MKVFSVPQVSYYNVMQRYNYHLYLIIFENSSIVHGFCQINYKWDIIVKNRRFFLLSEFTPAQVY